MSIERLRALADWCNDRQVHWAAQEGDYAQGRVNAFCEAEYEIRQSIAELGQEAGAEQKPFAYMEPVTFNASSPADFAEALRKWPDDYDDWFPVYTSPAHTSEARDAIDAARYRFIAADRSAAWEEELDAAMRQEAGSRE